MYYNNLQDAISDTESIKGKNRIQDDVKNGIELFLKENEDILRDLLDNKSQIILVYYKNIILKIRFFTGIKKTTIGEEYILDTIVLAKDNKKLSIQGILCANKTDGNTIFSYETEIEEFYKDYKKILKDFKERNKI